MGRRLEEEDMETESHSAVWTVGATGAGVLPEKSGWSFLGRDEGWVLEMFLSLC